MGIVNFGVPEQETFHLKNNLNLDTFVEGGTYRGETAKAMSTHFREVITIENSDAMFSVAERNLENISNITMLKGDTRDHLHGILKNHDNILFWLDAHWSGGETYGEKDECPLIEELKIIFSHPKKYTILIDDARLFLAPPPLPHNYKNWPSLTDIMRVLPSDWEMIEHEDVIYLLPKSSCDTFKPVVQKIITNKLQDTSKKSSLHKFLNKLGIVNC
jgi:hypothetical protein